MTARFAQSRQGTVGRLPRAGRAAVCGCVIGVGLSQFFYPRVRVDLCRPAEIETSRGGALRIDDAPIRVIRVRSASRPNPAERIRVTVTSIADLQRGDAGIPQGLRLLYETGLDLLRQEGERNV